MLGDVLAVVLAVVLTVVLIVVLTVVLGVVLTQSRCKRTMFRMGASFIPVSDRLPSVTPASKQRLVGELCIKTDILPPLRCRPEDNIDR